MRKYLMVVIIYLLFIPCFVYADSFDEADKIANEYLYNTTYRNTYSKYLIPWIKEINGDGNEIIVNGGFITYNDFLITTNNKNAAFSYLYDGLDYWTETFDESKNKFYVVSDNLNKLVDRNNTSPKTRVAEYVKSDTIVFGSGSRNDPWIFSNLYNIKLVTNGYGSLLLAQSDNCEVGTVSSELNLISGGKNEKLTVCLKPNTGYKYVSNSCSGFITLSNDKKELNIAGVNRDLNCEIYFGRSSNEITLDQTNAEVKSSPEKLYLVYNDGWFKDETGFTKAYNLDKVPSRTGYTYKGYYAIKDNGSEVQVIDSNGKIISNEETIKLFDSPNTLKLKLEPNKYTIVYNGNGATSGSMSNTTMTYGTSKSLSQNTYVKDGYSFTGWNTKSDGTGVSYTNLQVVNNLTTTNNKTITLYAMWKINKVYCNDLATELKCANLNTGLSDPLISYTGNCNYICDNATTGDYRIKFTTSGVLTLKSSLDFDVFLVGGGGGGSTAYNGCGGGGGRTKTHKNVKVNAGSYTITVGAGGNVNGKGGTSSAFGLNAEGGNAGGSNRGGKGGSGGACQCGVGGSYGNSGRSINCNTGGGAGGSGAGLDETTCEFGEGTRSGCNRGSSFAYGGGGGSGINPIGYKNYGGGSQCGVGSRNGGSIMGLDSCILPEPNTGGGGGSSYNGGVVTKGGTGIVIIRNKR